MTKLSPNALPDFINVLRNNVAGEIRTDKVTRVLFSTDASIYQMEPLGVFFPRDVDEISACVQLANEYKIPVVPRGSGSGLAGQAIGSGLIIDCSRHLDRLININVEEKTATLEPGLILSHLNKFAGQYDLQFGPDPASAERATMGGTIANNGTGAHSIRYGMCVDHVFSLETVLSDGSIANFETIDIEEAQRRSGMKSCEGRLYSTALSIKDNYAKEIQKDWPGTWRRASGYNLNYLLPWSPTQPPQWNKYNAKDGPGDLPYPALRQNEINLASIIAGSEGTLGVVRRATVRLVPRPRFSSLVLLSFTDLLFACESVDEILRMNPSAIELIPTNMIKLAYTIPSYAQQIHFLKDLFQENKKIPNLLAVEFAGENIGQVRDLSNKLARQSSVPVLVAEDPVLQSRIWNVRKVGLGLLMSIPGDTKPIPFIEDLSIPVSKVYDFISEMGKILASHNTEGDFYAHISAGCLHLRPLINLKSLGGVSRLREIALESIELLAQLGGVPSGEHGDGIARSEWLERVFGPRIGKAFRELKYSADPNGILNPGKIVDPEPMDKNLRYMINQPDFSWQPIFDFSKQLGLINAVELCNGAGVCRKSDGIMCPSFQVTKDEMHSTRGRANLLRALFTGDLESSENITEEDVFKAIELCLACKGCKAECPSGVDMAKLKYEFLEHYYAPGRGYRHPIRDYLFAYIVNISKFARTLYPLTNNLIGYMSRLGVGESWFGFSNQRSIPQVARKSLRTIWSNSNQHNLIPGSNSEKVLFLSDPFTEYYQPKVGKEALEVLSQVGCQVEIIPILGSGRTLISKGFIRPARDHAKKMIDTITKLDSHGEAAIVGIEPSEIYTLRDEYLDLFPNQKEVEAIASRAQMLDEYLIRPRNDDQSRSLRIAELINGSNNHPQEVLLHGHCYQKTQKPASDGYPVGEQATIELLNEVGYKVELIDAGCCGMAGAFGYEAEHFDLSMAIGELSLFPVIREAQEDHIVAASGFSCLTQILDGTGKIPFHPISLIHKRIFSSL